jgi:hypothetical protein
MEKGYNKHHTRWVRREWLMSSVTRKIREHPGMIIPLLKAEHNELHREIEPVRPPYRTLALVELAHLQSFGSNTPELVIPSHAQYLAHIGEFDSKLGEEARIQADHLQQQIEFLGIQTWITKSANTAN